MFLPAGIFLRWVEQHIKAIITAEEVMFNSFPPSDCLSCKKVPFGLGGGGGGDYVHNSTVSSLIG